MLLNLNITLFTKYQSLLLFQFFFGEEGSMIFFIYSDSTFAAAAGNAF